MADHPRSFLFKKKWLIECFNSIKYYDYIVKHPDMFIMIKVKTKYNVLLTYGLGSPSTYCQLR